MGEKVRRSEGKQADEGSKGRIGWQGGVERGME